MLACVRSDFFSRPQPLFLAKTCDSNPLLYLVDLPNPLPQLTGSPIRVLSTAQSFLCFVPILKSRSARAPSSSWLLPLGLSTKPPASLCDNLSQSLNLLSGLSPPAPSLLPIDSTSCPSRLPHGNKPGSLPALPDDMPRSRKLLAPSHISKVVSLNRARTSSMSRRS